MNRVGQTRITTSKKKWVSLWSLGCLLLIVGCQPKNKSSENNDSTLVPQGTKRLLPDSQSGPGSFIAQLRTFEKFAQKLETQFSVSDEPFRSWFTQMMGMCTQSLGIINLKIWSWKFPDSHIAIYDPWCAGVTLVPAEKFIGYVHPQSPSQLHEDMSFETFVGISKLITEELEEVTGSLEASKKNKFESDSVFPAVYSTFLEQMMATLDPTGLGIEIYFSKRAQSVLNKEDRSEADLKRINLFFEYFEKQGKRPHFDLWQFYEQLSR